VGAQAHIGRVERPRVTVPSERDAENVRDYGAVGDRFHDDADAVQRALDAASDD
jgi:polygalacturonase